MAVWEAAGWLRPGHITLVLSSTTLGWVASALINIAAAVSRYFPRHSLPSCELRWPASRELKAWPGDSLAGAGARTLLHIWTADDIYSLALSIGSWSMRKWSISTWRDEDFYIYVVPSNFISNGLAIFWFIRYVKCSSIDTVIYLYKMRKYFNNKSLGNSPSNPE